MKTYENKQQITIKDVFDAETVTEGNKVFMVMTLLKGSSELGNVFDVDVTITMDFGVDKGNIQTDDNGRYITVLERRISLTGEIKSRFEMKKAGNIDFNKGNIDWTVEIEHKGEDGKEKSLAGFKFEDPIKNVGGYVDGSFRIENPSGTAINIDAASLKGIEDSAIQGNKTITYIFPDNTPAKVIIKQQLITNQKQCLTLIDLKNLMWFFRGFSEMREI